VQNVASDIRGYKSMVFEKKAPRLIFRPKVEEVTEKQRK
jgi:hypothetical protein